jgi:tRNA (cmo5U34)-methyltransferase
MSEKDTLFESQWDASADFSFDERVARVFPDMINRSVPGYALVVRLTALLAGRYAQDASLLYDLGCSLGAVTLAMRESVQALDAGIVAVDDSAPMIDGLRRRLAAADAPQTIAVTTRCEDAGTTAIDRASVVVLNFTLQFIDPGDRLALLRRIRAGLLPGGVLLLSEKIRFESAEEDALQTEWHHAFKRARGYSDLEIARKRDALERVMRPDTLAAHRRLLADAGFSRSFQWFQGFNFASLIAFR